MTAPVTLKQELQSFNIEESDSNYLKDVVDRVCRFIDDNAFFDEARFALLKYAVEAPCRQLAPREEGWGWYKIQLYFSLQIGLANALHHSVNLALDDPDLPNLRFESLMGRIAPHAEALIKALLADPDGRAEIDRETNQVVTEFYWRQAESEEGIRSSPQCCILL